MNTLREQILTRHYVCGPVGIELSAEAFWVERLSGELLMFDVPFDNSAVCLRMDICGEMPPTPQVLGTYLKCNRFKMDRQGQTYLMAAEAAWCRFDASTGCATVYAQDTSEDTADDVEQFLIFALTWGWRAAGWAHMHAATVVRNGRCALICAESHGGKSTFTAACVRLGLQTLGDDKVLIGPGAPAEAYALSQSMNLDPAVSRWFPEAANIGTIAPYSRWTPKRKVNINTLWPGATRPHATPAALIKLRRVEHGPPVLLEPMASQDVMQTLARQIVIPSDREAASVLLPRIMQLATQISGWILSVSSDAYADPKHLRIMDELLA